jgi:hypothetical protein
MERSRSRIPWWLVLPVLIAATLLVAVWAVLITLGTPPTQTCGGLGCGPFFGVGDPSPAARCAGPSEPTDGCLGAGDYYYTLRIEESDARFGDVGFTVKAPGGANLSVDGQGGFNLLNPSGRTAAAYNMTEGGALAMAGGGEWTYSTAATGVSSSTPLTTLYTLVVDVGSANPAGRGYTLNAVTNSGETTTPITLP